MPSLSVELSIQELVRDPLIRLVMAADHVSDEAMTALLRQAACAVIVNGGPVHRRRVGPLQLVAAAAQPLADGLAGR